MLNQSLSDVQALCYIASYPDLLKWLGVNPGAGREHYAKHGLAEGRTITFDPLAYIASYPDLVTWLGVNPDAATRHYIEHGLAEGRSITFDPLAYIASYPDLVAWLGVNPDAATRHYIEHGLAEGRSVTFDPLAYIASYPDLVAWLGVNPDAATRHYIEHGLAEGRSAGFDAVAYLLSQPDLGAAGIGAGGAVRHWIEHGLSEGRNADAFYGREQATHELAPGTVVIAAIEQAGDRDWFQVKLNAGDEVRLNLSADFSSGTITVFDAGGQEIAQGAGQMLLGSLQGDTFYVSVTATDDAAGAYTLGAITTRTAITGSDDADLLVGTPGDDHLRGLAGDDTIIAMEGSDLLEGGAGSDVLIGGMGDDRLYGHSISGAGDDGASDSLYDSDGGDDQLFGQGGDDTLQVSRTDALGGSSAILLDGGDGNDSLYFSADDGRLVDTVTIIGGGGSDNIGISNALAAQIDGGAGDDYISLLRVVSGVVDAGSGNDIVLTDTLGTDHVITLGDGEDVLALGPHDWSLGLPGIIRVTDFANGTDRLDLDGAYGSFLTDGLSGWDRASNPMTDGFLQVVQSGPDVLLQVDRDGPEGAYDWTTLVAFQNAQVSRFSAADLGFDAFLM